MTAQTVAVIFTWNTWFDWLFLAGNLFCTFGAWMKGPHLMRICNIQISILIIVNAVMFSNLMSIVIETFALTSITIFYIRFFRNKSTTGEC